MCRTAFVLRVSKISDPARTIVRVGSIDPWQIILLGEGAAAVSRPSRADRSHASLFIEWGSWPAAGVRAASLPCERCVRCEIRPKPSRSLNATSCSAWSTAARGSYTIFPYLSHPPRVVLLDLERQKRNSLETGSRLDTYPWRYPRAMAKKSGAVYPLKERRCVWHSHGRVVFVNLRYAFSRGSRERDSKIRWHNRYSIKDMDMSNIKKSAFCEK